MKAIAIIFLLTSFMHLYGKVYIVSVVPQMPAAKIQADWGPFLDALSQETGLTFQLKHHQTIPDFEKSLERGESDFVFMNPYHQVMAYEWQKYRPLIHDAKPLVGILVVKKDSQFRSIKDLDGKTLVFPSPNAFAASLYLRALLEKEERISFIPKYVKTHNNVYRSVALGTASAGGGVNNTLIRENEELQSSLRILYSTKQLSPHPFSVHPRVEKKTAAYVADSIINMAKSKQYIEILDAIQIPNPVKADYIKEYQPLKKLQLSSYIDYQE